MTTRPILILAGCLALAAGSAAAAPLNTAQVAANALWFLHADFDNLRGTAPGRVLLDKLSTGDGGHKMDALATIIGVDLRKDLAGLTLYSASQQEEDGVALLHGRYNAEHLKTLLRANDGYRVESEGSTEVQSWIDEKKKKRQFGVMLPGDLLVVSGTRASLMNALAVLGAKTPSLSRANPNQLPLPDAGSAFILAGAHLAGLNNTNKSGGGRVLQQARSGSLSFREQGGQLAGRLTLLADSENAAKLMADMGRGLLAVAQLDKQDDPAALELLQGLRVEQAGTSVQLSLTTPAEKAAVWLRVEIEKDEQKKRAQAAAIE